MKIIDNIPTMFKAIQRVITIKDSVTVSLFSGLLGTLAMDLINLVSWRSRNTETLYGHIAGSVLVQPFRTNQAKNFWLGEVMHYITGAVLAHPLNYIFQKTGKDNYALKGAFFGAVTWEFIYGIGRKFKVFNVSPHMTKTHYTQLINNILYGLTTAQALVSFSEPSMFPNSQSKNISQVKNVNNFQPIYADMNTPLEDTIYMQ